MAWDENTYRSRIQDPIARRRHAAASPAPSEIEVYAAACRDLSPDSKVLVLGMTPELRELATRLSSYVTAVDRSQVAIDIFTDWLPEELRGRETVVNGCWTDLASCIEGPQDAILGDGIIGNLPGREEALDFMKQLRSLLADGGVCVMRNILVPESISPTDYRFERLLDLYRAGGIDDAEFGFTARILGFYELAYDPADGMLDNLIVYSELDARRADGQLDDTEWQAISRYRYLGKNYMPREIEWRELLVEAGFQNPRDHPLTGKIWYDYYPVQSFKVPV